MINSRITARYVIKTALLYCVLSAAFSFTGIFFAEKGPLANPVGGITVHEAVGHFLWGAVFGAVTLSARYVILSGLFAVLIDSDHLIALTKLEALGRMSHSITFGVLAFVILVILCKKDWRLGAISFGAVLSHISFDIFDGYPKFPIFAPWYNHQVTFSHIDWLYFEIAAILLVGVVVIITKKTSSQKTISS